MERIGADTVRVRAPEHLEGVEGVIVPGGESTTMSVLMRRWNFYAPLRRMIDRGVPFLGTCAGSILLSDSVEDPRENVKVEPIGGIDIISQRNAWGRQVESFEAPVELTLPGEDPFTVTGVFIRAPRFTDPGESLEIIGRLEDGETVAVQQGNLLAATFHTELTPELRLHKYFLSLIGE